MPRKKKPTIIQLVEQAKAESLPLETAATVTPPEPQEPAPVPKKKPHLRRIESRRVGNDWVHLVDTGYPSRALGVEFEFADPRERPSEAVKAPLKEGDDPLAFKPEFSTWLRRTGHDPVSDRIDVEMRFADAVHALSMEKEGPAR